MNTVDRQNNTPDLLTVLLLCRSILLICSEMPYTTANIIGTTLSFAVVAALALPLWITAPYFDDKTPLLYRFAGLYTAACLLSRLYTLMQGLQSAYPIFTLLLMLLAACFCFTLPKRTTGRVAEILMFFFMVGVILLLCRAFSLGEPLLLYTPSAHGITECFRTAMGDNLPLMLIPLCLRSEGGATARRKQLGRFFFALLAVPLILAAGTIRNGRLARWEGNPFFLLVAQSQIHAAIRTDGFWAVWVTMASILILVFCMQLCISHSPSRKAKFCDALVLGGIIAAATILFIIANHQVWLTVLLIFACVTIYPLYHRLHKPKGAPREA